MNLVRKDSSTGNLSGELPISGVIGRIDGSAVPAGYVGEVIVGSLGTGSQTTTSTSYIDVTGSGIVLTAGVWHVHYHAAMMLNATSKSASTGWLSSVALTDSSNNILVKGGVFSGGGGIEYQGNQVVLQKVISIASTTSYKIRYRSDDAAITTYVNYQDATSDLCGIFFAVRIA